MSDIVEARELIDTAIRLMTRAMNMMKRDPPAKQKAPGKRVRITDDIRAEVRRLADKGEMTNHQIAIATGLGNGGRVTDILKNKR